MKINRVRQNVFPMLAALIWGTAFVAQSVGADYVEPFTFNTARSGVAFIFLFKKMERKKPFIPVKTIKRKMEPVILSCLQMINL